MPPIGENILVVDDESPMRDLLRDFLVSQGYLVECHENGNAALTALRNNTAVTAVVADVRMLPMNGMELLEEVRRDFPRVPVVLFSAAGTPQEKQRALRLGAISYLQKPFPLTQLKEILARLPRTK